MSSESVKYIFGFPEYVEDIGNVYPIRMKDYDEFMSVAGLLQINDKRIPRDIDELKEISLFEYLILQCEHFQEVKDNFIKLFSLVLRENVQYDNNYFVFYTDNGVIHKDNYEILRKTIMKQNLIFEPRIFKNPLVQKWAESVIKARQKNAIKMTVEDMITTVHIYAGISYNEILEYTIYQLNASFNRINKFKDFDIKVTFQAAGAEKIKLNHYAEEVNMFKNPYDDLFKKQNEFKNINTVFKDGK